MVAEVERLLNVESFPPSTYPNGDQVQFLDLCFRCRPLSGDAKVNDDESTDVRWWPLDDLPDLREEELRFLERALSPTNSVLPHLKRTSSDRRSSRSSSSNSS